MNPKTLSDILAEDHGTIDAVLKAIDELYEELRDGRTQDWENPTLERFLEAMHAWLDATPRTQQLSWKFVEMMLRSAKIYE